MALPSVGEPSSAVGVLMVVAAVLSYGFAPNIARPLQLKYGALPVIWRAQAVALVLTFPLGIGDVVRAHWSLVPVLSLLALGARAGQIRTMVMREALWPVTVGAIGGVLVSLWLTRFLQSMLYQVTPYDVPAYAAGLGCLAFVVITAALIPAQRAAMLDPLQTLRDQ